jgi:hypothetical protein
MKTRIATLLVLFGLFIAASAFANEPVPASKAVSHSVAELVKGSLDYPEFAINEKFECCVAVKIIIQDDGSLYVETANSINDDMKNYVIEQIEKISSKDYARYAGQSVLVKVKFDLLLV